MSKMSSSDLMLVNRSGTSYQQSVGPILDKLNSTDKLLISRGNTSYQISGADFISAIRNPSVFSAVSLSNSDVNNALFTGETFATSISMDIGEPAAILGIKATIQVELVDSTTGAITSEQLFCKLDSDLKVIDLQAEDPGFTSFLGFDPTIRFPLVLPNGRAPDISLLPGTSIAVTIEANNLWYPTITSDVIKVCPGTTGTLYSNDSADVSLFNAARTAIAGYVNDRNTFRLNIKASLLSDGFTAAQLASINL